MRRLNCKFDPISHKAKNAVIFEKAKKKAAAEKEKKIEDEEKRSQKVVRPMFAIPSTDDLDGRSSPVTINEKHATPFMM